LDFWVGVDGYQQLQAESLIATSVSVPSLLLVLRLRLWEVVTVLNPIKTKPRNSRCPRSLDVFWLGLPCEEFGEF
jgi:hypothetical protein